MILCFPDFGFFTHETSKNEQKVEDGSEHDYDSHIMVWQVNDDGSCSSGAASTTSCRSFDSRQQVNNSTIATETTERNPFESIRNFAAASIPPSSPSSSSIDMGQPSPGSGLQTEVDDSKSPSKEDVREGSVELAEEASLKHYTITNQNVIEVAREAVEEAVATAVAATEAAEEAAEDPIESTAAAIEEPREDFTQHIGFDIGGATSSSRQ